MVTELFTKAIYNGQRIIQIKNVRNTIFYSTYTIDINITQMMSK